MEKNINFGYVADLYDYYANDDFDIDFYKKLCRGRRKILDLMCGTGRVSIPLIKAGYNLTCVDYSEEMLEVFKRKLDGAQHAKIFCQDICELDLEDRFDLIIIPSNSIAEIIDPQKRRQALRRIYEHLAPDGVFFCTLYNPGYRIQQADGLLKFFGRYDLENNKTLIVTFYNVYSPAYGIISGTQFYEIYKNSRMVEKRCLDIKFAVIEKEEICKMAREEGLSLKAEYGDYEPYHYDESSMFMNLVFTRRKRRFGDKTTGSHIG